MNATRPFVEPSARKSWWFVCSTLALLAGLLTTAALAPWWPVRLATSVVSGLLLARTFILYHDFMHGSILRGSLPAKIVMHAIGLFMLAPPRSWRESHNYHHANVAKLGGPAIGSYPILTTAAWRQASRGQRFGYRFSRHPLTILAAYLTIFAFTLTLQPLFRSFRKNWDSLLALTIHGGAIALLWMLGGPSLAFFVVLLPFGIAAALGAYLFYAQHNSEGIRMFPPEAWTYYRAALESASYLDVGPTVGWFLGNIGYHHVHHLNPSIPFYRLPEAMAAIPELHHPTVTSLRPPDVIACLRSNLWDEDAGRMVSYREAARRAQPPLGGTRSVSASSRRLP